MINEKAISLPFTIGIQGTVQTTSDQSKLWADKVFSVISTGVGERVNRYLFGTRIYEQQFDGIEAATDDIRREVTTAFNALLPLLTLVEVQITPSTSDGVLSVDVRYQLPNSKEDFLSIGTFSLNGNNPIKEK